MTSAATTSPTSATTSAATGSSPTSYEPPSPFAPSSSEYAGPRPPAAGPPGTAVPVPPAPGGPSDREVTRPYRPLTMIALGLAVLVGVMAHLLGSSWQAALAAALGVIGLGLVAAGLAGRRGGFLVPVAVALAMASTAAGVSAPTTAGEVTWRPVSATATQPGYSLGAGQALLDLSAPGLLTGATTADPLELSVDLGAGELTVVVPPGTAATVDTHLAAGEVRDEIRDQSYSGLGRQQTIRLGSGDPVLTVNVSIGFGQVIVTDTVPATSSSPTPSPTGATP